MISAFQWDLARQAERLDWLLAQLPRYADWGLPRLYIHLEDAVEYPSLPGVARPGAYSRRQFARLVGEATRVGIGVVPVVNLLGHTQYLIKAPELRDLNGLAPPEGADLPAPPGDPRGRGRPDRRPSPVLHRREIHVGLDESFSLGRCPACRAEVAGIGLAADFGRHVQRLNGVALARGLRLGMWADMLALLPEAVAHLPPGIIAYDGTTTRSAGCPGWSCATSRSTTWSRPSGRGGSSTGAVP